MKLIHVFLCLLLLALILLPASGLKVSTTVNLVGNGTLDLEAEANTEPGYNGLKYSEYAYTKSLGLYGLSDVNYSSNFDMVASDWRNSTINVESAFELTEIKQMACLRNYDLCLSNYSLLGGQSFFTKGDTTAVVMFAADNSSMSMDLAQELVGVGGYKILVRNSTNMHVKEYLDTSRYNGTYELVIGSFIGCENYPAAEQWSDWLKCPWGPTFGDCKTEEP
jgi:hypothetical protein